MAVAAGEPVPVPAPAPAAETDPAPAPVAATDPALQPAREALVATLAVLAALPERLATALDAAAAQAPPRPPLDPVTEQVVEGAAIAAIEGVQPRNLEMALEALLFSTNQPLTEAELMTALAASADEVKAALAALEKTLAARPSSIGLWSRAKNGQPGWILDVKTAFRKDVAVLAPPALRVALVETLALIALNQPVSQRRLVAERGSTVYEHVKELVELGYVQRQRRGVNFLLRTTPVFANEFGLPDDPEAIRHALAKAAGLAGTPGAIASERVWIDAPAPADLSAEAERMAETKRAEEHAAKQTEEEAARAAAEAKADEEAKRLAEGDARKFAEEAAKRRADEEAAAARAAAEAKAAEEARVAAEARRIEADKEEARKKAEEETRLLAIAAAARTEECVVAGGDLADVTDKKAKKGKKKAASPPPSLVSDPFSSFGESEIAW